MKQAIHLFATLHPSMDPTHGTANQWARVRDLAYKNQNDIVDVGKRHTPRSRYWARIGDYAEAQRVARHDQ